MTKKQSIISWDNYGLIAELAYRLKDKRFQFSKTALQKLIFLLQEIYGIKCGYRFDFYIYGPYCSDIEIDLSLVESWGGVRIYYVPTNYGGYHITVGENNESIREKASDFLKDPEIQNSLKKLIEEFGNLTAKELELISTIVYVVREEKNISKEKLLEIVKSLKPRFSDEEILHAINSLIKKKLIVLQI
ncbi:MAG: hypothetical protein N2257_10230 [Thermodesulfovibrionales bacterium]|nr:hypothetical protein [Thermodesulfovibrionales bacterium]